LILLVCAVVACGPATPRPTGPDPSRALAGLPPASDAPFELADDQDLRVLHDRYALLEVGAEGRADERARLAAAYARRVDHRLETGRHEAAYEAFTDMLSLWDPTELADTAAIAQLAEHAGRVAALRAAFARSGGDLQVALALAVQIVIEPERKDARVAELDSVFQFADDLTRAEYGDGSERARPIEILEHVVEVFPSPYALERLTDLYLARQIALSKLIDHGNPDFQMLQAHGHGMFRTAWNIVRFYARAQRIDESAAKIETITGVGESPPLRVALDAALAPDAAARAWMTLATHFVGGQPQDTDLEAALAVCLEGARRFPKDPSLPRMVAAIARERSQLPLAIAYTERAYRNDATDRETADELAELYQFQISADALADRPSAALDHLKALEQFHAVAAKRWPDEPLAHDLAEAYAVMGRGLLSQGEVERAEKYLAKSIARRGTYTAYEHMGTIHLKRDEFAKAAKYFERAIGLDDKSDRFARGRINRLRGEAYAGAGRPLEARRTWAKALSTWKSMLLSMDLSARGKAEALIESGRLLWLLEERDATLAAFEGAIDVDPDSASTYADIVSFLIVRDQYADALDAYHRALGSHDVGDYFKVYMSLWVLAEGRRTGRDDDPNALEYLKTRDGKLWHDQLARFAVGQTAYEPLFERANTRGRRAELYYYTAMLKTAETDPKGARGLLQNVLATDMLLFFEYDMAKYLLANGVIAKRAEMR
jgi:tetratricopeptide (TPR) repeat protein